MISHEKSIVLMYRIHVPMSTLYHTVVDRRVRITTRGLESPQPVLDPVGLLPPGSGLLLICGRISLHSTPTDQKLTQLFSNTSN